MGLLSERVYSGSRKGRSVFTLTKEFRFEAAHRLPHHDGKCQRLHGHSWKARVIVSGFTLNEGEGPKTGMLCDFADLSTMVKPLVEGNLDHYFLNESLNMESPTSEAVAQWLFEELAPQVTKLNVTLVAVEVDETCTSSCRYSR